MFWKKKKKKKQISMIHCMGKQISGLCPHDVGEIERHLIRGTYTSPVICYKSYFPCINFIYTVEGRQKEVGMSVFKEISMIGSWTLFFFFGIS